MSRSPALKKRVHCHCAAGTVSFLLFIAAGVLVSVLFCPLVVNAANDISIAAEYDYITSDIETTNNDNGDVTGSDFTGFDQNYFLNLSRELYPFLTFNAGSSFELDESRTSSDELTITRKSQNIRPYLDLDLRSPLYSAGIGYSKNQLRTVITDLPVRKDFQESLDLSFTYRPAGLPLVRIFHNEAHNYNDPTTTDTVSKQTTVKANYSLKEHPLSYTYGRGELDDKQIDLKVVTESHEGTASYSRNLINDRLTMDTHYRIRYNFTTAPGTSANAESPLSPSEGLFSADNIPQDGPALSALTTLIDGNLTASTGINIGWTASSEADRNIGLDFGFPLSIDQLRVVVDRNVSSLAANSFSWSVYTSPDNTDTSSWTLHATVFPASFSTFQNRFEISFPEVTARFIKVVVTPLSSTFLGTNPELENIFVTEIEAFTTTTVTRDRKITESNHNIFLSLAGRLSDKTRIGYNLLHSRKETDTSPSTGRFSWSNSIYLNHIFNRIYSASARVSRDESKSTSDNATISKRLTYDYAASLRAAYLETLSQTLSWGYSDIKQNEEKQTSGSIYLRTNAALYKGWDAFVDLGYSWDEPPNASKTTSTLVTAQTSVVPNEKISFDATYSKIVSKIKEDETSNTRQGYDLRLSYYPFRNLFFSFQFNVEEQSRDDTKQTLQRYNAGWSPFRGGDLQILLSYSETQRPSDDQQERSVGPVVKWDISRYASLNVAYYYSTVETVLETTELSTTTAKLTMTF